jgi:hypothetical protein
MSTPRPMAKVSHTRCGRSLANTRPLVVGILTPAADTFGVPDGRSERPEAS